MKQRVSAFFLFLGVGVGAAFGAVVMNGVNYSEIAVLRKQVSDQPISLGDYCERRKEKDYTCDRFLIAHQKCMIGNDPADLSRAERIVCAYLFRNPHDDTPF